MSPNPHNTPSNQSELSKKIVEIHERLHGRQATHHKVSKQSNWTMRELDNVLDQDAMLFEGEMLSLIESQRTEAQKELLYGLETYVTTLPSYTDRGALDYFIANKREELTLRLDQTQGKERI